MVPTTGAASAAEPSQRLVQRPCRWHIPGQKTPGNQQSRHYIKSQGSRCEHKGRKQRQGQPPKAEADSVGTEELPRWSWGSVTNPAWNHGISDLRALGDHADKHGQIISKMPFPLPTLYSSLLKQLSPKALKKVRASVWDWSRDVGVQGALRRYRAEHQCLSSRKGYLHIGYGRRRMPGPRTKARQRQKGAVVQCWVSVRVSELRQPRGVTA